MRWISRLTSLALCLIIGCGTDLPAKATPSQAAAFNVEPVDALPADDDADAGVAKVSTSDEGTAETKLTERGLDWPCFLGPHGTGISDETGLLDEWPAEGPRVVWDKKIGKGYSSPSIRGDKLVIHHRLRDMDVIECLRTDNAEPVWKYEYETDFSDPYGYSNGPRCSPLLTESRCYTFGAQGRLVCLNLKNGELVWERDTATDWKVPQQFSTRRPARRSGKALARRRGTVSSPMAPGSRHYAGPMMRWSSAIHRRLRSRSMANDMYSA
jgi:hypothetical protein